MVLPLLLLCGCFLTENSEAVANVLGITAPLTGGVPILKWIFLALVGGGVGKTIHSSLKENK